MYGQQNIPKQMAFDFQENENSGKQLRSRDLDFCETHL